MARESGFIFTNKKHSEKSIMSTVLGALGFITLLLIIIFSYNKAGENVGAYGLTCFLAFIYSIIGLILGILGKFEKESFYIFSYIGIGLSILDLFIISGILYAGAYGIG